MKARNMALCALFAALLAICSWIALPAGNMIFTLQTLGVFLTLGVLGGKRGFASVLVWLLLGAAGLPVFSGFRGGIGALLDVNGGYLWGFLLTAAVYWLVTAVGKNRTCAQLTGLALGLPVCYGCGILWFYFAYMSRGHVMGIGAALLQTLVPYLLPDILKLWLARWLSKKLRRYIR